MLSAVCFTSFSKANEAFVSDEYEEAANVSRLMLLTCTMHMLPVIYSLVHCHYLVISSFQLYSKAIELDNNKEDYYASRSHAYLKLERYSGIASHWIPTFCTSIDTSQEAFSHFAICMK